MSNPCNNIKDDYEAIVENDKMYSRVWRRHFLGRWKVYDKELTKQLEKEGFDLHKIYAGETVSAAAVRAFGTPDQRRDIWIEITALLDANPNIEEMVYRFAITRISKDIPMKPLGTAAHTGIQIDFTKFGLETLKSIRGYAHSIIHSTTGWGFSKGKIGGFYADFKTPQRLARFDPTGAFSNIQLAVREHSGNIGSKINLFTKSPDLIPKGILSKEVQIRLNKLLRDRKNRAGMDDIIKDVQALVKLTPKKILNRGMTDERDLTDFFSKLMRGWIFIDKNNNVMINQTYAPRRYTSDHPKGLWKKGDKMKYEGTNDTIYSFQDPTLLSEYIPHNDPNEKYGKKGSMDVPMTPEQLNLIKQYKKDARVITDALLEYERKLHKESTDQLIDGLFNHYDGKIDINRLRLIFFYGKTEWTNPVTRKEESIFKGLDKNVIKEINIVQDTFSMTTNDEMIIANGGSVHEATPEHRQNYWPTIYPIPTMKFRLGKHRDNYMKLIEATQASLDEGDYKGNPAAEMEARGKLSELKEKLESFNTVLDNMDLYNLESDSDIEGYSTGDSGLLHFAKDNKHFKRISNAYDIRGARTDDGVFYDRARHGMSGIERNNLGFSLLETLRILKEDRNSAKPKLTEGEADSILETAVNLHRTTYNSVKTTGLWGHSIESVSNRLNGNFIAKTFKWKTHPEFIARRNKTWSGRLSGLLLQKPSSVVTNVSGIMEQILISGMEEITNAISILYGRGTNAKYKEGARKLIQQSNITEFGDFFSKSMVSGITDAQLEEEIEGAILQEMYKYHNRIVYRGWKKFESREEFDKRIVVFLASSKGWLKAEDIKIRSKRRIGQSLKELRSRERLNAANKLVNYAINKEVDFRTPLKQSTFKKWLLMPPKAAFKVTGELAKFFNFTMSNGEQFIRSVSFIIGVQAAWEAGVIKNTIHWTEYTNQEDITGAINIGKEMAYRANFGMSVQDVGAVNRSLGQIPMKFKYWPQQAWEADRGKYTEFLNQNKDIPKDKKAPFQLKPILKLFTVLNKKGMTGKELKAMNPSQANLRMFILTKGLSTIAIDVLLEWPAKLVRALGGKRLWEASKMFKQFNYANRTVQWKNVMYSDYIHHYALPFTIGLRLLVAKHWIEGLFGGDDEEDIEKSLNYELRRNPFGGFGVGFSWNSIWAAIALYNKNRKLFQKKLKESATIVYGRPYIGEPTGLFPGNYFGITLNRLKIPFTGRGDFKPFKGKWKMEDLKHMDDLVEELARFIHNSRY